MPSGFSFMYHVNDVRNETYPFDGFVLCDNFPMYQVIDWMNPPEKIRLGFLDRFQNYRTQVQLYGPSESYVYQSVGPMPTNIEFPNRSDFSITGKKLNSYSYTHTKPFVYCTSIWSFENLGNDEKVTWNINAAEDAALPNLEIPAAFSKSPITYSDFLYVGTAFTVDGFGMDELLKRLERSSTSNPLPALQRIIRIND